MPNICTDTLFPFLIYNRPFPYKENILVYPVTMSDIISFQTLSASITLRKNSLFPKKELIKMTYLDFLLYCFGNTKMEAEYKILGLSQYYLYAIHLLQLCCKDSTIKISPSMQIVLNDEVITPEIFDDLRRIIILQNDIDFDIDEFLNYDTEQRLQKAEKDRNKNKDKANIEDYIDSLIIAMNVTEEQVMNMSIRKFWRYIRRYQLHEGYTIAKTGEYSGMVSFKEPISHWMVSLEKTDKYQHLKTDENSLKGKISNANN